MSKRIVWTDVALGDYSSILDYVARRDSPTAAARLDKKLYSRIESLKTHPERCRIVPELQDLGVDAYHELIIRPFRVIFRIRGKKVVLLAVIDGRRDLGELLLERAL